MGIRCRDFQLGSVLAAMALVQSLYSGEVIMEQYKVRRLSGQDDLCGIFGMELTSSMILRRLFNLNIIFLL